MEKEQMESWRQMRPGERILEIGKAEIKLKKRRFYC
jgi:hypothetical protein